MQTNRHQPFSNERRGDSDPGPGENVNKIVLPEIDCGESPRIPVKFQRSEQSRTRSSRVPIFGSFAPDLSTSVRIQKVQLHVQDLLVYLPSICPREMSHTVILRNIDHSRTDQYPTGTKKPLESLVVSSKRSVKQSTLRALVSVELYQFQNRQSLFCLFSGLR